MKQIFSNNGIAITVDEADYKLLSTMKWYVHVKSNGKCYAMSTRKLNKKPVLMHRLILNAKHGQFIDHINGDGLDNRKANLRFCTLSQNNANRKSAKDSSSKYLGVSFCKKSNKWRAHISVNNKIKHIGTFKTEIEAALAYNKMAVKIHGKFAKPNIIGSPSV